MSLPPNAENGNNGLYPENIPAALQPGRVWVTWDPQTKAPKVATTNGIRAASNTNPRTWRTFEEALEAYRTGRFGGIGRILTEGYVGIDFDEVRDPERGVIIPEVWEIIRYFDSYTEVSPSGDGVKIWIKADLEYSRERTEPFQIEVYPPKEYVNPETGEVYYGGRYFTITGQVLTEVSTAVEHRQAELDAFMAKEFPEPERKRERYTGGEFKGEFDLASWLEWLDIEILSYRPDDKGGVYSIVCPWAEEHSDGPGKYTGTKIGRAAVDGGTWFHCHHAHCADRKYAEFKEKVVGKEITLKLGKKTAPPRFTPEERKERADKAWETCKDLAKDPDITKRFADTLHAAGVAGESNQIRLLYLAVTSRLLPKLINVAVKGPSSSGKSYLVEQVLKAFPETAYYALSSMSEKALIYLDEDMRHRFLVIYEAAGMAGDMQTYLIRTLLSEGKIRYQTAEATNKGVKPRLLELEGPTGLLVTTTQTRMHPENETRIFSLLVTDTQKQTKDILLAMADEDREPVSLEEWHALQTWLEGQTAEVTIPYATALAELVPPVAVRLRRDFGAVLNLIRAHAVLHQAARDKDDKSRSVAALDDYRVVHELVADLVAEGVEAGVSDTVRATVEAVRKLTEKDDADTDDDGERFTTNKKVADVLKIDKSSGLRRVRQAQDGGYVKNLESRKGRPAKLALGEPLPAKVEVLPTPKKLQAEWQAESGCTVADESRGIGGSDPKAPVRLQNAKCNHVQPCNRSECNTHQTTTKHCDNNMDIVGEYPNRDAAEPKTAETREGSSRSATVQPHPKEGENQPEGVQPQPPLQPPDDPGQDASPKVEGRSPSDADACACESDEDFATCRCWYDPNNPKNYFNEDENPPEVIVALHGWIAECLEHVDDDPPLEEGSYTLKHYFEHDTGIYVDNGTFKGAMVAYNFKVADPENEHSWHFYAVKTPRFPKERRP